MVIFLAQPAGIGVHLGNTVAALVIDGEQFSFFGFDLLVDLRDRSWFKNRVGVALGWHARINGFSHALTLEKVAAAVLRSGFVLRLFCVSVKGHFRLMDSLHAGFVSVRL